jgi:hypothetical protein
LKIPGIEVLTKEEMDDAQKRFLERKRDKRGVLIHLIIFITSTCDKVEYLKLGFNKGPIIGATTEEPYIFCELSTCRTATSGIHNCPTLGLVGHSKKVCCSVSFD